MASVHIKSVKVQSGDTLWKIAERELGAGKYWLNLYLINAVELATNGHKVDAAHIGPNWIYPGNKITVIDFTGFEPSGN